MTLHEAAKRGDLTAVKHFLDRPLVSFGRVSDSLVSFVKAPGKSDPLMPQSVPVWELSEKRGGIPFTGGMFTQAISVAQDFQGSPGATTCLHRRALSSVDSEVRPCDFAP